MPAVPDEVMAYFQLASHLAALVVAVFAFKALEQIKLVKTQLSLAKQDLAARNERAAKEYALGVANKYVGLITLVGERRAELARAGLPSYYEGPVGDFTLETIPPEYRVAAQLRADNPIMLTPMNELEGMAAAFMTGVADEQVVFPMMGQSFCGIVASNYDFLTHFVSLPNSTYYSNTVALYKLWSSRLTLKELDMARESNEQKRASLAVPPAPNLIGTPYPGP